MSITKETRKESYVKVLPDTARRQNAVYDALKKYGPMNADELAARMWVDDLIPSASRSYVAPRLTELSQKNLVEVVGKSVSAVSGRTSAVWKAVE